MIKDLYIFFNTSLISNYYRVVVLIVIISTIYLHNFNIILVRTIIFTNEAFYIHLII